ncbi:MAG: hypothetical protein JWL99_5817, partial [Streptomyces oryziradicis]|nr:hypothetical protein [Actinacidiphila oryziradicis]
DCGLRHASMVAALPCAGGARCASRFIWRVAAQSSNAGRAHLLFAVLVPLRGPVPAASRCPVPGCRFRPQTPEGLGLVLCAVARVRFVRWLGRWRLRGDSPPTFGREVPPRLCARTRRSLRHRHRHLGDTVCGDTPAPPPPAVTAPCGGLCPAVTPGVARRAGCWFYGLRHGEAVTRDDGREGTRRGVPAGDERVHPGQACCGPARASPEEITPQRPRPRDGHGVAARTTTQPVRRLRTERHPWRTERNRGGRHDHPARPAFEDKAAPLADGTQPWRHARPPSPSRV